MATYLAVAHGIAPFLTLYRRDGDTLTHLPGTPDIAPASSGYAAGFSPQPGGTHLAVAHSGGNGASVYRRTGDAFTRIATPSLPGAGRGAAYHPSGLYLAFTGNAAPGLRVFARSGETYTATGDATIPGAAGLNLAWSPDGKFLAVAHVGTPFVTIFRHNGTGGLTVLTSPFDVLPPGDGNTVAWSPDGFYLAVGHGGATTATVYRRTGNAFAKITDPPSNAVGWGYGLSFTRDGRYLGVGHSLTPFVSVYRHSPAGTLTTRLTNPAVLPAAASYDAAWSPDDTHLALGTNGVPWVTVYRRDAEALTKVADPATTPTGIGLGTTWSTDLPTRTGYPAAVMADTPVGYWRLGEAAAAPSAVNEVPGGNAGLYIGTRTVHGGGLFGDRDTSFGSVVNAQVEIERSAALNIAGPLTVECWAYFNVARAHTLIESYQTDYLNGYALRTGGNMVLMGYVCGTAASESVATTDPLPLNTWLHLAFVVTGTQLRLYVNGVETATRTQTVPVTASPDTPLRLGARGHDGAYYYDGRLDEPAVYNKALSATRVAAHYDAGKAPFVGDGTYLAVAHNTSPFLTWYQRNGDAFTRQANPSVMPTTSGIAVAASHGPVRYLVVAYSTTPYLLLYKFATGTLTQLTGPAAPAGVPGGNAVAFSPDDTYLAVGHATTPFLTVYRRNGDAFDKLPAVNIVGGNPASAGTGVSWSPDGVYLAVAHATAPRFTVYKRSGDTFTKVTTTMTAPPSSAYDVSFSSDGFHLAVAHATSPFISIYLREGDNFTKLANPTGGFPVNTGVGCAFSPDSRYLGVINTSGPPFALYARDGDAYAKLAAPASVPGNNSNEAGSGWVLNSRYFLAGHSSAPYLSAYKAAGNTFTRLADPSTAALPTVLLPGFDATPAGQVNGYASFDLPAGGYLRGTATLTATANRRHAATATLTGRAHFGKLRRYIFGSFADANGIVYSRATNDGTQAWVEPYTAGRLPIVASSVNTGGYTVDKLVNRLPGAAGTERPFATADTPGSWVYFDFGHPNVTLDYYTLQTNTESSNHHLHNWKLQGSNNAAAWTDLDTHTGDTGFTTRSQWRGFALPGTTPYRYYRILGTGATSSGNNHVLLGEAEFYGTEVVDVDAVVVPVVETVEAVPLPLLGAAALSAPEAVVVVTASAQLVTEAGLGSEGIAIRVASAHPAGAAVLQAAALVRVFAVAALAGDADLGWRLEFRLHATSTIDVVDYVLHVVVEPEELLGEATVAPVEAELLLLSGADLDGAAFFTADVKQWTFASAELGGDSRIDVPFGTAGAWLQNTAALVAAATVRVSAAATLQAAATLGHHPMDFSLRATAQIVWEFISAPPDANILHATAVLHAVAQPRAVASGQLYASAAVLADAGRATATATLPGEARILPLWTGRVIAQTRRLIGYTTVQWTFEITGQAIFPRLLGEAWITADAAVSRHTLALTLVGEARIAARLEISWDNINFFADVSESGWGVGEVAHGWRVGNVRRSPNREGEGLGDTIVIDFRNIGRYIRDRPEP